MPKRIAGNRRDLLVQIAKLYYEQNLSQDQIAHKCRISRSSVSNLLRLCRDQKIVEIRVHDSSSYILELQEEIQGRYKLDKVIVVPVTSDQEATRVNVGKAAAAVLEPFLKNDLRIGITMGVTLYQVVQHISSAALKGVEVIQLCGGLGTENPEIDGFGLAQKLAEKLRGKYRIIQAPVIVKTASLRKMLVQEPDIAETLQRGANVDVALFGIGSNHPEGSALVRTGNLGRGESLALLKKGAVGTVCTLQIDGRGKIFPTSLNERIIGLTSKKLLGIPTRIGVATGAVRSDAVRAVLRGRYVTTIVIDEEIATRVLQEK